MIACDASLSSEICARRRFGWGRAGLGWCGSKASAFAPGPPDTRRFGFGALAGGFELESLALANLLPSLADPAAEQGPLIVNTRVSRSLLPTTRARVILGNSIFLKGTKGRAVVPWTPVFARENNLLQLPVSVTQQIDCAELLVVNESSARYPVFGNKARKYEFCCPT